MGTKTTPAVTGDTTTNTDLPGSGAGDTPAVITADNAGAADAGAPLAPDAGAPDTSLVVDGVAGTNSNMPTQTFNTSPAVSTTPKANVDPDKGSVDTSGKIQEADLITANDFSAGRAEIGKTYTFVNLKKGPDLVNPHARGEQPKEFPFNTPVEAEMDGFLQSQYLARRLRVE